MLCMTARAALALGICSTGAFVSAAHAPVTKATKPPASQIGKAAWYGPNFHGRPTASGEVFDMYSMTAAHRELPLGTLVRVTNLRNRRSVVVRINDRGPFDPYGRIIDLSYEASRRLGMVKAGVVRVRLEPLRAVPLMTSD